MRSKENDKKWLFYVISITLCTCIFLGIFPVSAEPPNTVLPLDVGQTVFLGEQNVELQNLLIGGQVAFFNSTSTTPVAVVTLSMDYEYFDGSTHPEFNPTNLGSWYFWDGIDRGDVAFILIEPNMAVIVRDPIQCDNQDRTGTTVMNTQDLEFRVSTDPNMYARSGGAIEFDINLTDGTFDYPNVPDIGDLIGLNLADNPELVGDWDTNALKPNGQYVTPTGTYQFTAICKINNLVVRSPVQTVTLVKPYVDVSVSPGSIQRGSTSKVFIQGEPETEYYFGIIECPLRMTGEPCDRPPWIDNAVDPINGTWGAAMTGQEPLHPNCCGGLPFSAVVPPNPPLDDGYDRYVSIITDCNGVASFLIDSDATIWKANDDPTYTIHVQKVYPVDIDGPLMEDDGSQLYDQTTLSVTKGVVTIDLYNAADPDKVSITEAYLGDFIGIKGTNTETETTYLYMTGPCQPECGGGLFPDPYPYGLIGDDFEEFPVVGGDWNLINPDNDLWWDTSTLPINPGVYTIYALSGEPTGCPNPNNPDCPDVVTCGGGTCELLNCPNCLVYAVATINLKKPILEANVSDIERCCCPGYPCGTTIDGHPIWVNGLSTGNTPYVTELIPGLTDQRIPVLTKDVNVWLFGKGKVGDRKFLNWRENVPCDGVFNFSIPLDDFGIPLCSLDPGVYDLIIQTKGYNQVYDVLYEDDVTKPDDALDTPVERNKRWILTTFPVNSYYDKLYDRFDPNYVKLVQVEGANYKLGTEVVVALIRGLDDPNIDDEYVHIQFTVTDKSCLVGTDFDADRTYGNKPLTVRFTDKSYQATSWLWDFGNGATSTEQNPTYTFTEEGRYTISLTTNGDDKGKAVKNDYIRVAQGPTAKFVFAPKDVTVGTEVQFTDLSSGNPTSWMWHFGDGSSSPLQSPVYTYLTPGVYTVMLTVSDETGISGDSATQTITVQGSSTPVVADFKTEVTNGTNVQFTDLSSGFGITSWVWDFGDGETSTERNPKHTYLKEGTYQVSLTVSNGSYENTAKKPIGIR